MSTNLCWEPTDRKAKTLSTNLKWALRKQYGEPVKASFDLSDVGYIRGLLHAGIEDAQALLDAIEKYECIDVYER
jgi:hypothetical protein